MKYRKLSKEQFHELHQEFAQFLATQQIDAQEWKIIQQDNPDLAEEELKLFSDTVWEEVLSRTTYITHVSQGYINAFKCGAESMIRIMVKSVSEEIDFLSENDFTQFKNNPLDDTFEYFKATKKYNSDRNAEIFKLIEAGAYIDNGTLFIRLSELVRS